MNDTLRFESQRLKFSWDKHPHEHLDTYLVQDVEDPRINAQSLLTRALIADTLFPNRFTALIDAEFQFAACMTWLLTQLNAGVNRWNLLDELIEENTQIPAFIRTTTHLLEQEDVLYPDYLREALFHLPTHEKGPITDRILDTFAPFWRNALDGLSVPPVSILEPACGSANDYRQISEHRLAPFLNYTGLDIASKNIENARIRYPQTNFREGNLFDLDYADNTFEYAFVHDLFEHLSNEGFERALSELLRVTRKEIWIAFFNLQDIPEHVVQPVDEYHLNTLSLGKTISFIEQLGAHVEVIDIAAFMQHKTRMTNYYNPNAKTLIISKNE